jgi:N-methylhydantoinase B
MATLADIIWREWQTVGKGLMAGHGSDDETRAANAFDGIALSVFASRLAAICDEMGAILKRSAFSPNIKDRLDFSCALFDARGELSAQAAHIPVHLGSMAFAMRQIVTGNGVGSIDWQPGDMVVVNDPFLGGTHLPDVTVIAPVFVGADLCGFVANRAHHANIGAAAPGSMPISRHLEEEGVIIPPTLLIRRGQLQQDVWQRLITATGVSSEGDFTAQISANRSGVARLQALILAMQPSGFDAAIDALNAYGEQMARRHFRAIANGCYRFVDVLDDDGVGTRNIAVAVAVDIVDGAITVDFSGTAAQVDGNLNCPLSVAAAAVLYVFRCLLPAELPVCAGLFRPITLQAPLGCLVNAQRPAAVAAGNVETSMRIVDALLGALHEALPQRIPAASQGTMNNVAMGRLAIESAISGVSAGWDYYETIGGGGGAHANGEGLHAAQAHMTNTLNTPVESLEQHYPLRVRHYAIRRHSGGDGLYRGGDGIVREYEFLAATQVTLLGERRVSAPWGLNGGGAGERGFNSLNGLAVAAKASLKVKAGDRLVLATPGGGGYGSR